MTSEMAAETIAATAIPASSNVATCTVGPTRDSRYTARPVARAPRKATTGTPSPASAAPPPPRVTTIAPSAAPEDTPMMAGSASGFRNNPWNTAPAVASAAPTSAASSTLGSRSWNRITPVAGETPTGLPTRCSFHPRSRSDVSGAIHTEPSVTAASIDTASRTTRVTVTRLGRARQVLIASEGRRVQVPGDRFQCLDHSRPGPSDQVRIDQEDVAVLHRGDPSEPRPGGHR